MVRDQPIVARGVVYLEQKYNQYVEVTVEKRYLRKYNPRQETQQKQMYKKTKPAPLWQMQEHTMLSSFD
jgi:hypothetical protein